MSTQGASDGLVRVDRSGPGRWRWRCPNGHTSWDRTNNHIWCPQCRRAAENGHDVDPEHYHIVDERTGKRIHWEDVEVVS